MKQILEYFGIYKSPFVGVDISTNSVKVMQINKKNGRLFLHDYAIEHIYENVDSASSSHVYSSALKKALAKTKINSELAVVSIPSTQAFTKVIQMSSHLSDQQIGEELQLEADKYIPYALSEVMLDYQILGDSSKGPGLVDVLLAASKSDQVRERISIIEEAGLKPVVVDVDSFAKERAFSLVSHMLPNGGQDKVVGLIDIGGSVTTLDVFDNFQPVYSRDQNFGGKQLLDEIMGRYGISRDEAVLAIEYGGLPVDYPQEVLDPFKQTIAQQISRACQFFFSAEDYSKIDYLFLTGGVSSIPGLDKTIEEIINIKTTVANPFTQMELSPNIDEELLMRESSSLLSGCGLALRNPN